MIKENRAEIVRRLAAQGMNSSQIARETGFSPGSVYYYMHPEKRRKPEIPMGYKTLTHIPVGMPTGRNAGAAGTGHDRNRSTDAITLSMQSTAEDVRLRTATGMCVGGG